LAKDICATKPPDGTKVKKSRLVLQFFGIKGEKELTFFFINENYVGRTEIKFKP
jgi:hypothetical protein